MWFAHGIVAAGAAAAGVTPVSLLDGWAQESTVTSVPGSRTISAGSNRQLIVVSSLRTTNSSEITAYTYGGQSMTLIAGQLVSDGPELHLALWRLNDAGIAAAVGTAFGLTASPAPVNQLYRAYSAVLQNVDQVTPVNDNFTSVSAASAANPPTQAMTNQDGGLALAAVGANRGTSDGEATEDASYSNMTERAEDQATAQYLSIADALTNGTNFTPGITLTHGRGGIFNCATFNPA